MPPHKLQAEIAQNTLTTCLCEILNNILIDKPQHSNALKQLLELIQEKVLSRWVRIQCYRRTSNARHQEPRDSESREAFLQYSES